VVPLKADWSLFARVTLPLAAMNLINQASRTIMAVIGPALAVEFALSASELGLLAACMFAAYGLAQLPEGVAIDLVGPRKLQAALAVLTAAGFAVFALSDGLAGLAAARVILGVGISASLIAVLKANTQWFAPAKVAAMSAIGGVIGGLGSLMTTAPVQLALPTLGWRGVMWVLCAISVAVALWIFFSVPESPTRAPRRGLMAELAVTASICGSRRFWGSAPGVAMLSGMNFTYLGLWAGPWLRDVAGFDGTARANTLLLYALGIIGGGFVVGTLTSRVHARGGTGIGVLLLCHAGLLSAQVGLALQPGGAAVPALWLLFAFCTAGATAGFVVVGQMFPPEQMGRVSTAVNTLTLAVAFVLQSAIGWILDLWPRGAEGGWDPRGYSTALALSAALQALAAVRLFTNRSRP
jgi:sugar phosphate permease